ncbi:hypothetical protein [Burkholderia seminalis]|uniref:hypothetical protein n=1 Tax=Burkholderia seminalis TaxID=488731 RepID=UPI001CF4F003|nr:hypothetical protein [Burkholderia seminalis]
MKIGILIESRPHETRVARCPKRSRNPLRHAIGRRLDDIDGHAGESAAAPDPAAHKVMSEAPP